MRLALFGGLVLAVLALASPASAGCWATVGLSPPPATLSAGDTWSVDVTVLQHGRNPLPDAAAAKPTVTIVKEATGERRTFTAASTNPAAGLYRANVVFPSNGSWSYQVDDGFDSWNGEPAPCASTHTFASVDVGGGGASSASSGPPSSPAASSGSFPAWPVGGGIAGALAAAVVFAFLLRRRAHRAPASA
jgi:hypothetical protein